MRPRLAEEQGDLSLYYELIRELRVGVRIQMITTIHPVSLQGRHMGHTDIHGTPCSGLQNSHSHLAQHSGLGIRESRI